MGVGETFCWGRWRERRPGAGNLCRRWHVRHNLLASLKYRVPKLLVVSESHQNVAGVAEWYEDCVTAAGWYSDPLPPPFSSFLLCPVLPCPVFCSLFFRLWLKLDLF